MRTQTEQVEAEVEKERRELERNPEAELEELAQAWIDRGLPPDLAREVATAVHTNPHEALRVHAREELGVDPTSSRARGPRRSRRSSASPSAR